MRTEESTVQGPQVSEFLAQSIADIQGTIRAIDLKLQVLVATLVVPLAALEFISNGIHTLLASAATKASLAWTVLVMAGLILLFASWAFALIFSFRGLAAVHDPRAHITGDNLPSGCFYAGRLFKTDLRDAIYDRKSLKSTETLPQFLANHPTSTEAVERELAFEKMKLAYICQVKLCRQKWAFRLLFAWAFALWLLTTLSCWH